MNVTPYWMAERYIGTKEVPGTKDNPAILAMLRLDGEWPQNEEVPWCSAFVNWICWGLRLPRSKSLAARSWLGVGQAVLLEDAKVGWDIVILNRANGPTDPNAQGPGHVGFFSGLSENGIAVLAGNQGNTVSVQVFPRSQLLGIRRVSA
jgi:uncharacterized protein (TIGR02594 family)